MRCTLFLCLKKICYMQYFILYMLHAYTFENVCIFKIMMLQAVIILSVMCFLFMHQNANLRVFMYIWIHAFTLKTFKNQCIYIHNVKIYRRAMWCTFQTKLLILLHKYTIKFVRYQFMLLCGFVIHITVCMHQIFKSI